MRAKMRGSRRLVIDARPRGPSGPLAGERVLGRPVLEHLLDLAGSVGLPAQPVVIHARLDEHDLLQSIVGRACLEFVTGPPPEHAAVLRADRLYDSRRLQRALRRGDDPESAVIWRLDMPLGLAGADDELIRRQTFQPLGRYWATSPARTLARWLKPTFVRPNGLTLASASLVLAAASTTALGPDSISAHGFEASSLAVALVLDTADGHLARLQGTATEFGRWLDANLDELGDMVLHAAIAWAAFTRTNQPIWLVAGMTYAMGKYLFVVGSHLGAALEPPALDPALPGILRPARWNWVRRSMVALGHADIRWHLWIVLAACGRLDVALVTYAIYFPTRALAGLVRKGVRHG